MGTETTPKQKRSASNKAKEKPRAGRTEAIIIGLVLAIIGSIVAGSYAKDTATNYAGFGMLLVGIAAFVTGVCSTATASVENRLRKEAPECISGSRPPTLCLGIWAIGAGMVLSVIGSILASTYAKTSSVNSVGFGMR